jgi:predicted HicB family RNase H-like nuclease
MSSLSLRLPDSLHRHIKEFSEKEGVSINQFISTAVAEKMSALSTQNYLEERAKRGSKTKLKKLLKKVPAVEPEIHDKIN